MRILRFVNLLATAAMMMPLLVSASLELPDIAQTFDAYDFFGETNLSDFAFRDAALLRLRFGPNCDILTDDTTKQLGSLWPASAPRPAQTVAFADYGEMSSVRCGSYSDVLVRLHRVAADLTQKRGLPPVVLTVFAAGEPSTKVFGSAEAEPLDDYWTKRPAGMRTALVAKDTGDLLLQLFDVGGKLSNGSSVPAQPVLRVNAFHDEGPWNRFLHSTYFKVEGIINYILFGASCLFAAYMLGKSLLTGTWNRWLKTVLVIDTMFFMIIAITCPQRGPLTNLQYTMQYLSWMVCGGTTNLTLLKWTGFMRSVFKDKPLLYRGLVAVASLNIAVWTVAMIIMIAGRYVSNLNVGLVGGLLFAMIAPILFVVLAVYALALAILYTRRLQSMRISTVTKQLLMRVTHLMTVFFAGWFLISLCALFLGAGLTYNITWFCIGNAVYTVGVFVLFTGILIILDLADRIQDRGSLRSTSNPSRSQGAYLGASSTGGSRNGGTIGKAYADATNGDDDVDASKMGYVIDDGNDVLFPDEVNPPRQHRQPQAHQIEFGIPATPTVLPIHAEKNQYEYNGSPSSGHLYPPSHTHSARGQMRDQDLQLSSEHIRSNQSPPLRPRYAFPKNTDGHGEVTLVPLGGAKYEDNHDVRFDPLGQRY